MSPLRLHQYLGGSGARGRWGRVHIEDHHLWCGSDIRVAPAPSMAIMVSAAW